MQRIGVRAKLAYVPPAVVAWAGIYAAGIHPTIAGVIVGLMTPVRAWLGADGFVVGVRKELKHLENASPSSLSAHALAGSLHHVDMARREAMSPAASLIESLHPWVEFVIMPVFALANAGVALKGPALGPASWLVASAVAGGLVVGKPAGVLIACGLALKTGIARLPTGVTLRHLVVLGTVAGVGFTMALFIAQLAFAGVQLLAAAKLGVILASATAAVLALVLGRILLKDSAVTGSAQTADEAEGSTNL
jgi:NhaA family Na+:H+ antiporter